MARLVPPQYMSDPHNYAKVGYSMILVSASLVVIAIVGLGIGADVLYGDKVQRAKTIEFEACKATDFEGPQCEKFLSLINNDVSGIWLDPRE